MMHGVYRGVALDVEHGLKEAIAELVPIASLLLLGPDCGPMAFILDQGTWYALPSME